jgi:hypothetical protein
MADRAAAELQHHVVAEQVEQLVHLACVYAARRNRHHLAQGSPVLFEMQATGQVDQSSGVAADRVVTLHGHRVALELAHRGAGVDVVDTCQPHPLGDHPETHAMVLLAGIGAVTGPVQVQNHVVLAAPVAHALDGGVADHQIDHDDDRAQFLGELGAPVHFLHRAGRHVQVAAFDLAVAALALLTPSIT